MELRHNEPINRASADSHSLINEARKSCEDSTAHVVESRRRVAQSLELLRRRIFEAFG